MSRRGKGKEKEERKLTWIRDRSVPPGKKYHRLIRFEVEEKGKEVEEEVEKEEEEDDWQLERKSIFEELREAEEMDRLRKKSQQVQSKSLPPASQTKGTPGPLHESLKLIPTTLVSVTPHPTTTASKSLTTSLSMTPSKIPSMFISGASKAITPSTAIMTPRSPSPPVTVSLPVTETSTIITTMASTTPITITTASVPTTLSTSQVGEVVVSSLPLDPSTGAIRKTTREASPDKLDKLYEKISVLVAGTNKRIDERSDKTDTNFEEVKQGQADLKKEQEEIRQEQKEMKKEIGRMRGGNRLRDKRIDALEKRVEFLEEQNRRPNIVIRHLPEKVPDNLRERLNDWFKTLGMEQTVMLDDIAAVYRLGSKRGRSAPRNVLVKFSCSATKMRLMSHVKTMGPSAYKIDGTEIEIYNDISLQERMWRQTVKPMTKWLREKGVKYNWLFPRQLVIWNGGRRFLVNENSFVLDSLVEARLIETGSADWKELRDALFTSGGLHFARADKEDEEEEEEEEDEDSSTSGAEGGIK